MDEYTREINGVTHTFQLDKAEAERLGAVPVKAKAPANKAKTASNKGASDVGSTSGSGS